MVAISRLSQSVRPLWRSGCTSRVRGVCGAAQAALDVDFYVPSGSVDRVQGRANAEAQSMGPQWVFLGCPGVGKGTYASQLAKLLDVPHIAMGDLVREALKSQSVVSKKLSAAMAAGKLLPDEVVLDLFSRRLEKEMSARRRGFILDGFPRNIRQAEVLEEVTEIDLVVNLKLREDILIAKCLGRRICSQCGGNFNLTKIDVEDTAGNSRIVMPAILPPLACAQKLIIRPDDTEEAVRTRLRVYTEESAPVEDFYRRSGKLLDFDVAGGIPETWPKLLATLNSRDKEHTRRLAQSLAA